jgi:hypothetical protein
MTVTAFRKTDPTAAERQRRHRKKQAAVDVVTRDSIVPAVTLTAGLALACVSAGFSIVGLTAIFTGAFWPIIGMGVAFELGKISAVMWFGRSAAPRALKAAIVTLIVTLMALNAIGAYGFLSHAHLEHAVTAELPIAARATDIAARTEVQRAVLADIDRRIGQIDTAVDVSTQRGRTTGAMALAGQEDGRRSVLVADRLRAASALAALQVEAAQVEGDRAKFAADSGGPVHYLACLVGAADESVMRFFILAIAVLLDPLAVALLLAATVARRPA